MTAEPYGPSNADDMQYGEVVDVPMSCFWMDGTCGPGKYPCMDNSHYAASLAHVWGRRYVADEAFTSGGLQMGNVLARLAEAQRAGNKGDSAVGEGRQDFPDRTPHFHDVEALDEDGQAPAFRSPRPGVNEI